MKNARGLFVGLTTVDIQYELEAFPVSNSKVNALQFTIQPGGPAYNASVTFSFLGGRATTISATDSNILNNLVQDDSEKFGVKILDLSNQSGLPPISTIITERGNGNRTIIGNNYAITSLDLSLLKNINVHEFDILMWDGFYPEIMQSIVDQVYGKVPIVVDGGSWKSSNAKWLPYVDIAICSENFRPPGTGSSADVLHFLRSVGVLKAAVTRGERSILFIDGETHGEIEVPVTSVVDTLGAGDIFHGAFCFYWLQNNHFVQALEKASRVAALSGQSFGTRSWMDKSKTRAFLEGQNIEQN